MILYYILASLTILLYLYSFFPIGQNIFQRHQLPTNLQDISFNRTELYSSDIEKTVIIIIDALRYDFLTNETTPGLLNLIERNGCLSLVKVESPTVTLPRIKALTTGSVPQFIDVVLNLLNTQSATDSILHQAIFNNKKIVFYGDDTWLKLYPDIFLRSEGTSSFYVYDYHEVDDNVTRCVQQELLKDDWDMMILHYLGLDHIGHVSGPFSPLIQPKLKEMNDIIEVIYNNIKSDKKLIVVTGDHGMKDSGGHGGTTYSETRVPFLLLGEKCTSDSLAQSDIPMILSALLALPFPSNSIGKISTKLLSSFQLEKLLYILRYNSLFLGNKTDICKSKIEKASEMHYNFLKEGNLSAAHYSVDLYEFCLDKMSSNLTHQSVEQDDVNLVLCLFVLAFSFVGAIVRVLDKRNSLRSKEILILAFISSSFFYKWNIFVVVIILFITFLITVKYFVRLTQKLYSYKNNSPVIIIVILTVFHSISMASSSFIEEEHQTWYFFFTTFLIVNFIKNFNLHSLIILLLFRVLRKLNQTGDKWAAEPDITQWLLINDNSLYYHLLFIISLILIGVFSIKMFCKTNLNRYTTVITLTFIYIFKIHATNYPVLGQLIWSLIFINCVLAFHISPCSLVNNWILITCLLYRPQNTILVPFCIYTSIILSRQIKSMFLLSILYLWLGNVLYFCQGHSNSLASVDIAAGYVGLQNYIPIFVSLQILCHTYSMPVLTNLLLLNHYNVLEIWNILSISRLLLITTTFTLSFIQRHHLFVWSVFAPKILFESSHTVVLLLQMLLHNLLFYVNNLFNKKY